MEVYEVDGDVKRKQEERREIKMCLNKVSKGVQTSDDIWQKVHNATNTNQKEKYAVDLKKEIKELQKLLDQIKTWMVSSEMKDKRILLKNQKLIETQMEKFEVVERETKTKAYSKEGLGAAQKFDRAQKEQYEMKNWAADCIERFFIEIDWIEIGIKDLSRALKERKDDKEKLDRREELKGWIEKRRYHIKQLETLMGLSENTTADADQIQKIKNNVKYYIKGQPDPDVMREILIKSKLSGGVESSQRFFSPTSTNSIFPAPSPGLINHSKSNCEDTRVTTPTKPVAVRESSALIIKVENIKGDPSCVSRNNNNSCESSINSTAPLNQQNGDATTSNAIAAAANTSTSRDEVNLLAMYHHTRKLQRLKWTGKNVIDVLDLTNGKAFSLYVRPKGDVIAEIDLTDDCIPLDDKEGDDADTCPKSDAEELMVKETPVSESSLGPHLPSDATMYQENGAKKCKLNPLPSQQASQNMLILPQPITAPPKMHATKYNRDAVILPLSMGWMRELVHRAKSVKTKADVYYHTPEGGKLRSFVEISNYLSKEPETVLTVENFTFSKELIYRVPFEIERTAKQKSVIAENSKKEFSRPLRRRRFS